MKLRYIVLTTLYCLGLFWLSSGPAPIDVQEPFPGFDKILHALLYAGLAALVAVGMRRSGTVSPQWALVAIPIGFAALYGVSDEIHQAFVPTRTFDLVDIVADGAGALGVLGVLHLFWMRRRPARTDAAQRNSSPLDGIHL
ncbi:MAG: VanZ family protein [Candidatus Hydrogenedentes bacterium]|nr:VanZ family protein [Candidatus Hydrogenedentota bacterium]